MGQYCCCISNTEERRKITAKNKTQKGKKETMNQRQSNKFDILRKNNLLSSNRVIISQIPPIKKKRKIVMKSVAVQTDEELILSYLKEKKKQFLRLKDLFEVESVVKKKDEISKNRFNQTADDQEKIRRRRISNNVSLGKKLMIDSGDLKTVTKKKLKNTKKIENLKKETFKSDDSIINSEIRDEIMSIEKPLKPQKNVVRSRQEKKRNKQKNRKSKMNQSLILSNGRHLQKKLVSRARHSIFGNLKIIELQKRPISGMDLRSVSKNSILKKTNPRLKSKSRVNHIQNNSGGIVRRVKSLGKPKKKHEQSQLENHFSLDKKKIKESKEIKQRDFMLKVQKLPSSMNVDQTMLKQMKNDKHLKRHSVLDPRMLKKFGELSNNQRKKYLLSKRQIKIGGGKFREKLKEEVSETSSYASSDASWVLKDLIKEREEKEMLNYQSFQRAKTLAMNSNFEDDADAK